METITPKLIPPVIKWTGSKRTVAHKLFELFPNSKGKFIDPFVGGGAILPYFREHDSIAGDIIPELINLWINIRDNPNLVANEYEQRWSALQSKGYTEFYKIRADFNRTKNPFDFLFLSRTCVNGLIRYNHKGEFNNSLHHTRPGINPNTLAQVISNWSSWVKNTNFYVMDYRETLRKAEKNDLVFLDPPYVGSHSQYFKQNFDHVSFFNELGSLNKRGIHWVLTFDGISGERKYTASVPKTIYKEKFELFTGKSTFSKVQNNKSDKVFESVYCNFDVPFPIRNQFIH